nr:MAG TPA: major capsid protein [Caudoviricetes sp.]
MANDLSFDQLSTVLTAITNQATGVSNVAPIDTASFISVAQMALKTGYDPLTTAISQVLSRTIFSVRPYTRKFKGLNVSNQRYGNHVRKLLTIDKPFEDDDRFKLTDGESIDQYRVNKPKVLQTNFYGANVYQKSVTIYKDQLDCAFSSPDEFASFISMVMQNASDMIEQAHEETARATINNLISGIYAAETTEGASNTMAKANGGKRAINLLSLFNKTNGEALTVSDIFKAENFESFVKFAFSTINTLADLMTDRNTLFSSQLTNYTVIRHTPKDRMKFYLYTDLVNKINSEVYSSVFNPDFLKLVDFERVNFWQSALNPSQIKSKPVMLNKDGTLNTVGNTSIENVFGVLFDEEAAGYTTVNVWSQPTPFNARGGYYNQFWHFTDRYWNDFTENAIVFYVADPTAS